MQVSSHLMVVWGVLYVAPPSRTAALPLFEHAGVEYGIGLPSLLLCWGVTEVVRYSFYFCKLLGAVPYPILWARYTLFLVLYPLGVSSELFLAYSVGRCRLRVTKTVLKAPMVSALEATI
jgi:very-long-chain (3R)-3-hydroxyacyl-CoA dehydratase